jgi:hypothetical protein
MIDKSKRDGKFGPVSQEGIFLGYDGFSRNYRVLIDSKVIVQSREYVKFDEMLVDDFHSDLPPLGNVIDEDVPDSFEVTSDSIDVHEDAS